MRKTELLKILTLFYGAVVVLGAGSFLISVFIHGDLVLFKAPRRFEWVAGDIVLLLMILWGLLFALSSFWRRNVISFFCVLLAFGIVVLVGWNNWTNGNSPWWGILPVAFLFLLPSFTTFVSS